MLLPSSSVIYAHACLAFVPQGLLLGSLTYNSCIYRQKGISVLVNPVHVSAEDLAGSFAVVRSTTAGPTHQHHHVLWMAVQA